MKMLEQEVFEACMERIKGVDAPPHRACLYWAQAAVEELAARGVRAIIQAGSASWRMVDPVDDDGVSPTHFSYIWTGRRVAGVPMPEMHVWCAVPPSTIIDLTTWAQPLVAAEFGMAWPAKKPPLFVWGDPPEGSVYKPELRACLLAHNAAKTIRWNDKASTFENR